jgi:hypothetical protein
MARDWGALRTIEAHSMCPHSDVDKNQLGDDMNLASTMAWLALFGRRRGGRGAASDSAEMGTAFGLDAITPPRVDVDAVAPSDRCTGPVPGPAWDRRVVRRSRL